MTPVRLHVVGGLHGEHLFAMHGTTATFAPIPPNSEIWADKRRRCRRFWFLCTMVGFYGVAARRLAQSLELVMDIGSDGHFGTCAAFRGALRENLYGTIATCGLGPNLRVELYPLHV